MGMSGQTKDAEGTAGRKSRIFSGMLITLIIVLCSIIWSIKAHQIDPAQDPNWIPLSELQQAQKELDQQKQITQSQKQKIAQLGQQTTSLQQKIARQSSESERMISLTQLPLELRGDTVQSSLDKIRQLQQSASVPQNDSNATLAYFAILDHLQQHGVINTAEPAGDTARQELYDHILTALASLKIVTPDGDLQQKALNSIKRFQTEQKVKVDGKIGMQTFMAMVRQFQQQSMDQGSDQTLAVQH